MPARRTAPTAPAQVRSGAVGRAPRRHRRRGRRPRPGRSTEPAARSSTVTASPIARPSAAERVLGTTRTTGRPRRRPQASSPSCIRPSSMQLLPRGEDERAAALGRLVGLDTALPVAGSTRRSGRFMLAVPGPISTISARAWSALPKPSGLPISSAMPASTRRSGSEPGSLQHAAERPDPTLPVDERAARSVIGRDREHHVGGPRSPRTRGPPGPTTNAASERPRGELRVRQVVDARRRRPPVPASSPADSRGERWPSRRGPRRSAGTRHPTRRPHRRAPRRRRPAGRRAAASAADRPRPPRGRPHGEAPRRGVRRWSLPGR